MARVKDIELFTLVRDYFKIYLPNQCKRSPHTIRAYQRTLEMLFDFVTETKHLKLTEVTFNDIDNVVLGHFLDNLEQRGCSVSTRNHRLSCVRAFFYYAAKMKPTTVAFLDEILKIPMATDKKSSLVEHMSETAVEALLKQPDTSTTKGLRDQFLMLLLYDTGARIQELLDARLRDIRLHGGAPIIILHGKNKKSRAVPLSDKAVAHYRNYTKVFHPGADMASSQYLFYVVRSGTKKRMTEDNARKMMHIYGVEARKSCIEVPENVHPHLWRHSRAMHLYRHGMPLVEISQWLGHANLETTLIYAHADTEHKRRAIECSTPDGSPLKKHLDSERFQIDDVDTLKRLWGLR